MGKKKPLRHFKLGKAKYLKRKKFSKKELDKFSKRKICYIYAFRHGITNFNRQNRFTGCIDSVLDPKQGVIDAKKIAQQLKNKKFEVAYTSHLKRAKQTLKYTLKFHPEVKELIEDDRIIERCYGDLERKSKIKYAKEHPGTWPIIHRSYEQGPPNGETFKQVERRVNSFIKDMLKKIKAEKLNVAISCHGNSLRPLRRYFEKFSKEKMCSLENPWDRAFVFKIRV